MVELKVLAKFAARRHLEALATVQIRWSRLSVHAMFLAICISLTTPDTTNILLLAVCGMLISLLIGITLGARFAIGVGQYLERRKRAKKTASKRPQKDGSRWADSTQARVLQLIAIVFPAEFRAPYIEDQCGNLASAESKLEWVLYLLGQILGLPWLAWAYHMEDQRERAK